MKPLTAKDLEALEKESWISADLAQQAQIYRVDRTQGAAIIGASPHSTDYAGIVFPVAHPITGQGMAHILRRDTPDIIWDQGVAKSSKKYIGAFGVPNHLYFVPGTAPELLKDASVPLVITEGAKKCLCLHRLSFHGLGDAAEKPTFLPVSLQGVYSWRGVIGKRPGPDHPSQRLKEKGPIPDLDWIEWKERRVTICFDSDAAHNPMIQAAMHELVAELQFRGAQVHVATIPERGPKKMGIDDYTVTYGPEESLKVLRAAEAEKNIAEEGTNEQKQAALFRKILKGATFFSSPEGQLFATVPIDTHMETVPLLAKRFTTWLTGSFFRIAKVVPSKQRIAEALQFCEFRASHDGLTEDVFIRVAGYSDRVYIDMADEQWHAIEIDADGWRMITNPPVKFRRAKGMSPLPWPEPGGSLKMLRAFLNADDEPSWIQMLSWLIGAFNPKGPYPILLLQGEQGTAKSTQAKVLRALVDPATAPLRAAPREERDLMIGASNAWVLNYDNLSGLPHWLSDALCRLSTGGGFATRTLHSDGEETIFNSCRPIIANGIDDIASNGDLADRAMSVNLQVIDSGKRRAIEQFEYEFQKVQPKIFGAILDAVSAAIQGRGTVKLSKLPRMADFALWIAGAAKTGRLPFTQADFEATYFDQATAAAAILFERSPVAMILRDYMTGKGTVTITPTELLDVFNRRGDDAQKKAKDWPKNPSWVTRQLKRIAPVLRQHGLDIRIETQGHAKTRVIQISWVTPEEGVDEIERTFSTDRD